MASRRETGFLRRDEAAGAVRRRRTFAAFVLGAGVSIAGLAALESYPSLAHGPFTAANPTFFAAPSVERPSYGPAIFERKPNQEWTRASARNSGGEEDRPRRHRITVIAGHSERSAARGYAGAGPVCVRLCDGFFFPLSSSAGDVGSQNAACDSLCPDAPTEVYYRNGTDGIEGAVSALGRPYSALPVSLRYRGTSDNTCTCHRDAVAYAPLHDATLKWGDAVMTPAGFMVFRGHDAASHKAGEFTALGAAGLSSQARGALQAMERASLAPTHPTLKDWLVSQTGRGPQVATRAPTRSERGADKIRLLVWSGTQN